MIKSPSLEPEPYLSIYIYIYIYIHPKPSEPLQVSDKHKPAYIHPRKPTKKPMNRH